MNESRGRPPFESKGAGRVRRAQLPLLDRLIDAEPDVSADRSLSTPAAMELLRAGVCRDLEELLNTRRRWQSWQPGLSHLKQSLVAYGLPDFASGAFNDQRRRDELRQLVEECIRTFEPRITNLKVSLVEATDRTSGTLRLRIDAMLRADPAPEPIIFDTVVDLVAKTVTVSEEEA